MEGEWSGYRSGHFNGGRMDNGPYGGRYGGGQFKRGRMVMLQFNGEHGHVTEVASFNGERMVILWRWPI